MTRLFNDGHWHQVKRCDPRGVIEMIGWDKNPLWRCSIFRNEGPVRSSELVREATWRTFEFWRRTGGVPPVPLRTEVDPSKTRRKRDPGRCFVKAGWKRLPGVTDKGLVVLEAPRD